MTEDESYLVTLQFDAPTFAWLQALRAAHFPAALNHVPAHLTLLHRVSAGQVDRAQREWRELGAGGALPLEFSGVRSLGRGTALSVESPRLAEVRARLMRLMSGEFSPQDLQPFRPHVTVQNKVEPALARALLQQLATGFEPRAGQGLGLMIWRYLGGPWSLKSVLTFQAP